MKKIIKKIVVCFCIVILLFTSAFKPKEVKADAGALSGGLLLGGLNPAVLPWVVLGIVACVVLGYTIEHFDEVKAVGGAVADELKKMGHSVGEFVSGTSVKIDGTLKQAIKNVGAGLGSTATVPSTLVYKGGLLTNTGVIAPNSTKLMVGGGPSASLYIGTEKPAYNWIFSSYSFKEGIDYLVPQITVKVELEPTDSKVKLRTVTDSGIGAAGVDYNVGRNEKGQINYLSATIAHKGKGVGRSVYLDVPPGNNVVVKSVSVPEIGLGERMTVSTEKLKQGAIDSSSVDKYIDTAFPKNSETVTFKSDAQVASLSLPALPRVSDKTYSDDQLRELNKIRAGTGVANPAVPEVGAGSLGIGEIPGTGSLTGAGELAGAGTLAGSGATTAAGTGLGWLDKIIEWLKKLLNAILGIPGAILNGLKALWDWLAKILQAILAIPGGIINILSKIWEFLQTLSKVIADAITGAITWTFSIDETWLRGRLSSLNDTFRRKFPVMVPLRYDFNDKDTFSDMSINILGSNYVILNGAIATKLASPIKMVFRALAYVLMALFFARKFHKVAED